MYAMQLTLAFIVPHALSGKLRGTLMQLLGYTLPAPHMPLSFELWTIPLQS